MKLSTQIFCLIWITNVVVTYGYNIEPIRLHPELSSAIIAKAQEAIGSCSPNQQNEMNDKIEQCISNFESSGDPAYFQQNIPGFTYDSEGDWNEETEREWQAYRKERYGKELMGFCSQLNGTIQCLHELRVVFESCDSPVGITAFNFADVICQNEAKFIRDFSEEPSYGESQVCFNRNFDRTFTNCAKNKGLFDETSNSELEDIIGNICEFASGSWYCLKEGFKASDSEKCNSGQTSMERVLDKFYATLLQHAGPNSSNSIQSCIKKPNN